MKSYILSKRIIVFLLLIALVSLTSAVSAVQPQPHPTPDTWVAGETSVSNLTDEEKQMRLGVPLEVIEWEAEQAAQWRETAVERAYSYPAQIDWRDENGADYTTPIKDQANCGSCVAFGVVGAIESRLEVFLDNPLLEKDLSEDNLFFCGDGDCDTGWWPNAALDYIQTTGVVDEACQPYEPWDRSCDPCADWQDHLTKIAYHRTVFDPAEAKEILANGGPLIATFEVYDDFHSYQSGIYQYTWGDLDGGHAVALVGYNDEEGYWIGKNSWGTRWGEDGWFRIAYGQVSIDDAFYVPVLDPETVISISPNRESTVPGISYYRADILSLNEYGIWSTLFDASDLGIATTTDLHGFTILDDGSILMVFDVETTLPGLDQPATPWDVVRFIPTTLGDDTAGAFANCELDGSNQLAAAGEKIDALHVQNNALYLSVEGGYAIDQGGTTLTGNDEDILKFTPDGTLCGGAGGTWSIMLENAVEQIPGLAAEDVISLWLDADLQPHISMLSDFVVMGVSGNQQDVLELERDGSGNYTGANIYWHGPFDDFYAMIDGLHIGDIPQSDQISGTVTDEIGGSGLGGISVKAFQEIDNDWEEQISTITDSDGTYQLSGLDTGTYRLGFFDLNTNIYAPEYYDNQLVIELAEDISYTSGSSVANKDAALSLAGSISGNVTNESNGQPLEGISVYAYLWDGSNRYHVRNIGTDSSGNYELGGLGPGDYIVWFWDWSYQFIQEKYDNAPDFPTATPVTVTAGQNTPAINAALAPNAHITGSVTAENDGTPLEGITVEIYQNNDGNWDYYSFAETGVDGFYDFWDIEGLASGSYRVGFFDYSGVYAPEYYDNSPTLESATDIPVTAGTIVSGIDAQLAKLGSITGTVTAEDTGFGLEDIYITVYQRSDGEWNWYNSASTNPDGTYEINGLETGIYRLGFQDYNYGYAPEYYDNALDLSSATDISVNAGETVPGINAALQPVPPPPNDDFDDAVDVIGLPFTDEIIVSKATVVMDDPDLPCGPSHQGYGTVWYAYTPAVDMGINADTYGSSYDTVLVIWDGWRQNLNAIACNDDSDYSLESELLDVSLSAGVTYYIEVAAYSNYLGDLELHIYSNDAHLQEISLESGWTMISSCVYPADPDLDALFASVMADLVLVKNGAGEIYWPAFGVNQIGTWDVREGYLVYMSEEKVLTITGSLANPEETPIDLNSGWNLSSYLEENDMATAQALSSIEDSLTLVKNGAGQIYWPDMNIYQLDTMHPGEGYKIFMNSPDTLIYP